MFAKRIQIKLKELDLESETFSLGEIACVFAGRFDLFVYSFAGKPKNNRDSELDRKNLRAEGVTRSSKGRATGNAGALAAEGAAAIVQYVAPPLR